MSFISNQLINDRCLLSNSSIRERKSLCVLTFGASEKSEKAKNIAKRLFRSTKPSDWKEPLIKKWFGLGKETRIYNDKQYGKVIIQLYPVIKNQMVRQLTFVSNKKMPLFCIPEDKPTTARMIIANEGIDISTQEHYHPVMQLALDVIQHETSSFSIDSWF